MRAVPTTGYYVEVDIAGDPTNAEAVQRLRNELRGKGISLTVIELNGPAGGNPSLRLRSTGRTSLQAWLDGNGYERAVHEIVDARNKNAVPRSDR